MSSVLSIQICQYDDDSEVNVYFLIAKIDI